MAGKSSESQGYGLLISAVVAIVAIVGQVILFNSSGTTGQFVAMSGSPPPYPYGIGEGYARGVRYGGAVDTSYPQQEGYAGAYYDFDTGQYVGVRQSSFDRDLGGDEVRYSGDSGLPKGYRSAEGGMYTEIGGTEETFYRGEQGRAAREGRDSLSLPTESDRGEFTG